MTYSPRLLVLFTLSLALVSQAVALGAGQADAGRQLDALLDDYWDYYLREHPLAATQAGVNRYDDRLPRVTPVDRARRLRTERDYLRRVRSIPGHRLDTEDRVSAEVLEWVLQDSIRAHELDLARIPFNTFSGFFMAALQMGNGLLMESAADYRAYISRLRDVPRYFAENIANLSAGGRDGFVLPQIVIAGVLPTLEAQLKSDPADSPLYDPFREMSGRLSADERTALRREALDVVATQVIPAFDELLRFLRDDYPASAEIGATALPGGPAYYAFQVRRYTTLTDTTAEAIHAIGLAEVARIRAEMQQIVDELGFEGDLGDFAAFMREDPQFYATTAEGLLKEAAWTAKRIDYRMPGFFLTLPRQPYGIVPVPEEIAPNYTTGAYYGVPPNSSHGGEYWVNTYALHQRPLYELPALTLHEAVPGHHHQGALAAEMENLPAFRRQLYFSAFGEGWALYAERLGVEMGIYRTPYEHFGRLSYEMWRACRLVIDTGIHALGWTRQRAMTYMADNTSLSAANVRAEIDRYISWPGQALAYKLGELKIRELRREAEHTLGDAFDLRRFHDVILGNGALPLATLEAVVARHVAQVRRARR